MTNSNGNRSDIKPSAKVFFVISQIVMFLFGIPFAAFGIFAFYQVWKNWHGTHDPKHNPIVTAIFGLIFSAMGFGIMFWAVTAARRKKKREEIFLKQTDGGTKPWLLRADWAAGKIKSSNAAQLKMQTIFALAFGGFGGLISAVVLPKELHNGNYKALLVLIFPAVGIGILIAAINARRSQKRFGDCFFELAQIPVPLGGVLEGMIQTGAPLKLEHDLHLKISCIRRVVTSGEVTSGEHGGTSENILWQNEKIYSEHASLPQAGTGTGIPVHFKLPADQPEPFSRGNESVFWRLDAKTKLRGPSFHAQFELPVFKIAGAEISDAIETEDTDPTASFAAPIEEIRHDNNSKIKISDGPNGREFYFPAARNLGMAFGLTGFFLVWSGFLWFMLCEKKVPMLFPIVFGLVDVFIFFGCLNVWFKSSRITIDSTKVRMTSRWLIFSRTREFSASDVTRFAPKTGMQSGSTVYTDIKLVKPDSDGKFAAEKEKDGFANPKNVNQLVLQRMREASGPSGVTVASSIGNVAEANWLIAEMNKALGRQ